MTGRIYVYRSGGIITAGIEGNSKDINIGVKEYKKKKKIKYDIDFSPIFRERDNRFFLVGNIYFPEVCTMVAYQYFDGRMPNTNISCHGTSDIAINLVKDFGKTLEFKTTEPSGEFKQGVRIAHIPIEALWEKSRSMGRNTQKEVLATALGLQQQKYREEKNKMN